MDVNLVFFKTDGQRRDIPVAKSETIIGRGSDCDLQVPLLTVSRHHCRLEVSGDGVTVKDLGSANGTFVNNDRIEEAEIGPGDLFMVGPAVFTVQINGVPAEIQPLAPPKTGEDMDLEGDGGEAFFDIEAEIAAELEDSGELDNTSMDPVEELSSGDTPDPLDALEALSDDEQNDDPPPEQ